MTHLPKDLAALLLASLLVAGVNAPVLGAGVDVDIDIGNPLDMVINQSPSPTSPKPKQPAKKTVAMLPAASETRLLQSEVLVETKVDIAPSDLAAIANRNHVTLIETADIALFPADVHRFHIDDGRPLRTVLLGLNNEPKVLLAQPNYTYLLDQSSSEETVTSAASSAPPASQVPQYAADMLHLVAAHAIATGRGVKIGLLDTAITDASPELAGSVTLTFNAAGNSSAGDASHGTALAGIIAAHATLAGVSPAVTLLSARAFVAADDQPPTSNTFVLLKGLDWLAKNGAQVVNMSFAGAADPLFSNEIRAAHDKGILAVAAVGNDGPKAAPDFPGADPTVLAVTAVDDADGILPQANQGGYVGIAAPGVDVLVLAPDGSYATSSGTSIAAAHVSGAAALLLERNPALKPDGIEAILIKTALDLGKKGRDSVFGAGLVAPPGALALAAP